MLTDVGPGIVPYQFALIQAPPSTALSLWYWSTAYLTTQRLQAVGWDTSDPVFYEQCNGMHPQGAIEFTWLAQQILQPDLPNPKLPRIPQNQARLLSARVYAVLVSNVAKIVSAAVSVFPIVESGGAAGVGLTSYGPVDLPLGLDLTDIRGRREHYTVAMCIEGPDAFDMLAQQQPQQSPLNNCLPFFSAGGATFHLTYRPLTVQGRSRRTRQIDVILPLHVLRILLGAQRDIVFAQGRLAALL